MKRFLSAFILFAACSLMAQPQAILRNAMTTNIAGTPVLSRSDLSVTNVGSGTNWLFYGTAPNTVARLVDIALGAGTLWATLVSNADGSVTVYTNTANVGTNIYGLSSAAFVNYASNALQTSMSNTVGYVSNILNNGIVTSSNKAHLDLTNLTVLVSNNMHLDLTNLNVVTSNALQTSMSNTVGYVSNVLAQGAIAGSNQMHLDLTNLTVLVSNATHVDMTNLVNNAASNRVVVIAGANVTVATNSPAANVMSYTVASTGGGSGAPFATVVTNANGTVTVYTNTAVTGTNIYGLAVADPLNLTTMNVQDFNFTNVTGTFTNSNNFGTNKPGVAGQFLTSDGGYLYWSTIDQSFGQAWFVWGSSNTLATNSGGVAYKAMQKSDVTLPATPNTNTYTTPIAGQYIGEVITAIPAGVTAILPGDINTVSFIYLSENRTMVLQPEIYLRTNMIAPSFSALGELEIGVGPTFTVNNVFTPYTISVAITTNVPMSVTNYLVRKYKVISVSGGTPNALFVSQGQYPARVTFPIGSASFVLKSGDTMSGNLVVNGTIYGLSGLTNYAGETFASTNAITAVSNAQEFRYQAGSLNLSNWSTLTTNAYQSIWIDAGAMATNATGGPTVGYYTATNFDGIYSDVWDFDSTTPQTNYFKLMMPDSWDLGTLKVKFFYFTTAVTASTSNMWGVCAQAVSPGDLFGFRGTEVTVSNLVQDVTNKLNVCSSPAITVGGTPALGDMVHFQLRRVADSGWDNSAGNARLLGVAVQWQDKRNNPAQW